jgi:hypothetical protein
LARYDPYLHRQVESRPSGTWVLSLVHSEAFLLMEPISALVVANAGQSMIQIIYKTSETHWWYNMERFSRWHFTCFSQSWDGYSVMSYNWDGARRSVGSR